MDKEQLLNILYSERSRLKDRYEMPGWTPWAIIAAIAAISIEIIKLCYNASIDFSYSLGIACFLFSLFFFVGAIVAVLKTKLDPIWGKGDAPTRIGIVYVILCNCGVSYWFRAVAFEALSLWLGYIGIAALILLNILYVAAFGVTFIETVKNQKADWSGIVLITLYAVICAILGYYCYCTYAFISESTLLFGVYLVAILVLVPALYNSKQKKLTEIDHIIDKAIYSKEVNADDVLNELEEATVGLRYGKYLVEQNADYIKRCKEGILWAYGRIDKEYAYSMRIEESHKVVGDFLSLADRDAQRLKSTASYLKQMISIGYDKKTSDRYKNQVEEVIEKLENLIGFNSEVMNNYQTMSDPNNFRQYFEAKYKELTK